MRLYLKILLVTFVLLAAMEVNGQDIHFSQFNSSPMNLNPALAGAFDGAFRFVGNERRQWGSISTPIPYQTFGLSIDARSPLRINNLGVGLSMYNDVAGDSKFGTTQVNLAASYFITINKDSTQFLSIGAQTGITQRKINTDDLRFDNQYNGYKYDELIPVNEVFGNMANVYPNFNAGINWLYLIKERTSASAGVSLFNINTPDQSFLNESNIKLDRRLTAHAATQFKIAEKFDLIPSLLYMKQGTFNEFDVGGSVKYILDKQPYHYRALYLGLWTRTKDAGWLSFGMDYDNWNVGISYDLNYSKLRTASNGRGGVEVSVIYIIRQLPPKRVLYKACPNYI